MNSNFIINTGTISGTSITQQSSGGEDTKERRPTEQKPAEQKQQFIYDIAISYASEQTNYVTRVAKILEQEGFHVFFAPFHEEEFIGKDMITEFYNIYRYKSMFVVCFISPEYVNKDYTMHEATTALIRKKHERRNCMIPVCFNQTRIEGMDPDQHFIDADRNREVETADKISTIVRGYTQK